MPRPPDIDGLQELQWEMGFGEHPEAAERFEQALQQTAAERKISVHDLRRVLALDFGHWCKENGLPLLRRDG